jgi:hypothetical protein
MAFSREQRRMAMGAMKLARHATDDPERIRDLEAAFDERVSELLAEANDAGFGSAEAMVALQKVVKNQAVISEADPDPADDPNDDERRAPGVRLF